MTLSNVTLIAYDNVEQPERTLRVLQHCARLIEFAAVVLVCRIMPQGANGETIHLVNETGYDASQAFEIGGLADLIETPFALTVQHDGYILNPQAWSDRWFDYDYIGSPWPAQPTNVHPGSIGFPNGRVGNSGFCLKSKAFIEYCYELSDAFDPKTAGDVFTCRTMRPTLEACGMKYAPVEVAADFGWEYNIEEFPQGRPDAFGFHAFSSNKRIPAI